ncbi:MAG TPA: hypothetical protein VGA36_02490 [Nitriliruptorales bacterium]
MSAVSVPVPGARPPARRPALRLVTDERSRPRMPWILLLAVLFGGAVFASLTMTALAAEDAVLARELANDVTRAEREYARLVAEVATLESPERIAVMAEKMGMVRTAVPRALLVDRPLDADVDGQGALLADGDGLKPLLTEQR